MRNGGLQTLKSFKIGSPEKEISAQILETYKDQLCAALPNGMEDWLRALPTQWSSGNVHIVHAAADPKLNMEMQNDNVLCWGDPDFFSKDREDGQWIVHGHTIVDYGDIQNGRISVDTGAYVTERLTGAFIMNGDIKFIVS